jgi:hypothetical protein
MTHFMEQRICIKFCFNLKKPATETHWMLHEAFGDNAMSQSKTFLRYKRFKNRWTSVDYDKNSGRPSTSTTLENIAKVREAILADRRQTIHDVCEIVGLSYGTVQCIFVDNLNTRRISARFVPRLEWRPEGPSRFCLQVTQTTGQRWLQLHLQYCDRWWNMGVWLWPW